MNTATPRAIRLARLDTLIAAISAYQIDNARPLFGCVQQVQAMAEACTLRAGLDYHARPFSFRCEVARKALAHVAG